MMRGRERGRLRPREHRGPIRREIWPRVEEALAARRRRAPGRPADAPSSPAESCSASASPRRSPCARVCCCSTSRRRSSTPRPPTASSTSSSALDCAVVVSEQRPARPLARADRVLFVDEGRHRARRAARRGARRGCAANRPLYLPHTSETRLQRCATSASPTATASCSTASRWRCAAARSSRSPARTGSGKTTLGQASRPGSLEPTTGEVEHAPAGFLDAGSRPPPGHASACSTRSRSAPTSERARAALGHRRPGGLRRAPPARPVGRRARAPRPRRGAGDRAATCWCSTSRPAVSTPSARTSSPGCCAPRLRVAGTLVITHDLVWAAEVADRVITLDPAGGSCMRSVPEPDSCCRVACCWSRPCSCTTTRWRRCWAAPRSSPAVLAWFESGPGSTRELTLVATLGAAAAAGRVALRGGAGRAAGHRDRDRRRRRAGARARASARARSPRSRRTSSSARESGRRSRCSAGPRAARSARCSAPLLATGTCSPRVAAVLGFAFSASMDVWLWYGFFPHTLPRWPRCSARGLWFDARARGGERGVRAGRRPRAPPDARPLPASACRRRSCGRRSDGRGCGRARGRRRSRSCRLTQARRRLRGAGRRPADPSLTAWAVLGLRAAGDDAPGALHVPAVAGAGAADDDRRRAGRAGRAGARRLIPTRCSRASVAVEKPSGQIGPTARLDVLGRARARPLAGRDDAVRAHAPGEERRLCVERRGPARFERHRGGARGCVASRTSPGGRSSGRSRSCSASRVKDGGFELAKGRGSDAQSTAWAIQGLARRGSNAAAQRVPYLARMKRPDGSYRYSSQYVTTPVWVTAQVLAALAKKPF